MSDDATTRTTTGRGEFFAVDRRAWAVACRRGLNPAVAYLVLACFTGRDQRTTKAGVHAIERHAGIARSRARTAIEALERAGLVTKPEGKGTTRRIVPAHEVSGCQGYPPPEVDQREQTLLDELTGHGSTWVTDKGGRRTTARGLVAKGRARHLGNNYYQAVPYDAEAAAKPDWIWLPNALVTGVADEVPPIELVRQSGDPRVLQILVDLYHAQNLVSDGGVHWRRIRRDFKRVKVGERGPFVVWGFQDNTDSAWGSAPFIAPHLTGQVDGNGRDEGWNPFWVAWDALKTLGLVELVGHLIEADTAEAEIIHPFAVGSGEPVERDLAEAAHRAGLAMVTRGQYEWARGELGGGPQLVPVLGHITGATVVGIARLRYRPRTAATAAWFARTEDWRRMIDRYRVMEVEAVDQRAVGAA